MVLEIYKLTRKFPKEELFGIVSQLRRAASSITANLSEGFARYHFKDKIRFYYQSRGSLAEVNNFLILAKDLKFIRIDEYDNLKERCDEIGKLINGLIKSINNNQS